jgi:hypothetical protein
VIQKRSTCIFRGHPTTMKRRNIMYAEIQGQAVQMHLLSTRLYDVAVGCALALLGTLVAKKWVGTGNAALPEASPEKTTRS